MVGGFDHRFAEVLPLALKTRFPGPMSAIAICRQQWCKYLRGREAEDEQEQNFANQSALAVYA